MATAEKGKRSFVNSDNQRVIRDVRPKKGEIDMRRENSCFLAVSLLLALVLATSCSKKEAGEAEPGSADVPTHLMDADSVQKDEPHMISESKPKASPNAEDLLLSAEAGDRVAQFNLSCMYASGTGGVMQDAGEALKWCRKAAEQGLPEAQANIGFMYRDRKGLALNYGEAIQWLRKAADQGNAEAQLGLGGMYLKAQGVTQDYAQALAWLRKAAEQGNNDAQLNIGVMYANGHGVPKDMAEAVKWWRKAAEKGLADAQFKLGMAYYLGNGIPQNYREAFKWFRQAAEKGDADAQNNLGTMYAKGQSVPADMVQSLMWLTIAASSGNVSAKSSCDIVAQHMSPNQITEAKKRAREWRLKK